jgi:transcriptional regulator with XRE-family HTH domain
MVIGERLKALRTSKKLSQGHIEKRTGLFRCYISRVENGGTVPSISTLEKMASALEVPMYQLFFDGDSKALKLAKAPAEWASSRKNAAILKKFGKALRKISEADLRLLVYMAQKMHQKAERAERLSKTK